MRPKQTAPAQASREAARGSQSWPAQYACLWDVRGQQRIEHKLALPVGPCNIPKTVQQSALGVTDWLWAYLLVGCMCEPTDVGALLVTGPIHRQKLLGSTNTAIWQQYEADTTCEKLRHKFDRNTANTGCPQPFKAAEELSAHKTGRHIHLIAGIVT